MEQRRNTWRLKYRNNWSNTHKKRYREQCGNYRITMWSVVAKMYEGIQKNKLWKKARDTVTWINENCNKTEEQIQQVDSF